MVTRYFTHYWRKETVNGYRESGDNSPPESIPGKVFRERGVKAGDVFYPVIIYDGILYLICRLDAEVVCDRQEATERLGYEPWLGSEPSYPDSQFVIAARSTVKHFDLRVPIEITRRLRFLTSSGVRLPVFKAQDLLDQQTMRGVRELTPECAADFDELLISASLEGLETESVVTSDLDSMEAEEEYLEGSEKQRLVRYYERNPKLRTVAIEHHGLTCKVCGFDFEEVYRKRGKGYIEVHHLVPVSTLGEQTKVDPKTDMTVICSNCHRMIHRRRDQILTLEQLRSLLKE